MMNKILALPQAISEKAVNILNGKLTVSQTTGLRFMNFLSLDGTKPILFL
ncbi:MAG: hypothetical protein WAN66_27255 [Limnoraphis robusta]|nr:hypothetical protein [Limnoraphis robusta]